MLGQFLTLAAAAALASEQTNVWPLPTSSLPLPGSPVVLAPGSLHIIGVGPGADSAVLAAAIARYSGAGGLIFSWPNSSATSAVPTPFTLTVHVASANETLEVGSCGHADPTVRCIDESYTLNVTDAGGSIVAPRVYGALYGLETFAQLVQHSASAAPGSMYTITPIAVADAPRFEYRSLMIDTARHFLNVSTIFKIIESMAMHKLNVLQIHLTDDQSFPFQSISHPNLTAVGAFNNASIYTHADVTAIVQHANARGIVVQVELDMPSHCNSWRGETGFLDQWDLDHHTSSMPDPSKPRTYQVITDVLAELRSLGVSTTLQIGGDEFSGAPWEADPALKVRCSFSDRNLHSREAIELHALAPLEGRACVCTMPFLSGVHSS
jgi:hexosaminidase